MGNSVKTPSSKDLSGQTAIVTGGTYGVGRATVAHLLKCGARVVLTSRWQEKAEAAAARAAEAAGVPADRAVGHALDLTQHETVREFAAWFLEQGWPLNILVENASFSKTDGTALEPADDGTEQMFHANHLGNFFLTMLLADKLRNTPDARVVVMSSAGWQKLDLERALKHDKRYSGSQMRNVKCYLRSKAANLMFAILLSRKLADSGVTVFPCSPHGTFADQPADQPSGDGKFVDMLMKLMTGPEGRGATTTLWLALDAPAAESGTFYAAGKKKRVSFSNEELDALWEASERLTGASLAPKRKRSRSRSRSPSS